MCDVCLDCDNITLPTAVGTTGATGATGADGSDGSNGTTVLHNDVTQSTTTSATKAVFSADKTYTLPANTLSTNGSKLRIVALFSSTGGDYRADSTAYIEVGGTEVVPTTGSYDPFRMYSFNSDQSLRVEIILSRVSTTVLFVEATTMFATKDKPHKVLSAFQFTDSSLSVSDISANTLVIQAKGKTANTTTFNCDQLTVDHLIK